MGAGQGDWLGMAAQLALLRSRLLLPPDAVAARSAQTEAEALRRRLLEAAAMRQVAVWLDGRVQLGRDVFARGIPDQPQSPRAGDVVELLRACLVALRVCRSLPPPMGRAGRHSGASPMPPPGFTRLLAEGVAGDIALFLPLVPVDPPERDLRCRAALASTLVAGLEMAREGGIAVSQDGSQTVALRRLDG